MPRRQSQSTGQHPLAAAIRAEATNEAPAEPRRQSIPPAVWSVLRGLRNRGYSVQQISTFLSRHGYHINPDALAARLQPRARRPQPTTGQAAPTAADPDAGSASDTQQESSVTPTAVTDAGQSAPPVAVSFMPAERAQYQIPEWGDGLDIRPDETPEKYARRKRLEGPPRDRSHFIGET